MSLGIAFSAGETSCSHSSIWPLRSYAVLSTTTKGIYYSTFLRISWILLHPKNYRVRIQIQTGQKGIGNLSHSLRMAYRDRATDTVGAQLGSTDTAALEDSRPSTIADRESASASTEKDNLVGHHRMDKQIGRKTGTQEVASLGREIGEGLFREAWPRGTTPRVGNHCIVTDGLEAQGNTTAPCCQETRGTMLPIVSSS